MALGDADRWSRTPDAALDSDAVAELLSPVVDDLWVAAACADRILDDADLQDALLALGLSRTQRPVKRVQLALASAGDVPAERLAEYFAGRPRDKDICRLRAVLLERRDRLLTYREMANGENWDNADSDFDPWADNESVQDSAPFPPPVPLSTFLVADLVRSAHVLASHSQFKALALLFKRHHRAVYSHRLGILSAIPEYIDPTAYQHLLPSFDIATQRERPFHGVPWRDSPEWVETALSFLDPPDASPQSLLLGAEDLFKWYGQRTADFDRMGGCVDAQLKFVQLAMANNVPGLEQLQEELHFLSQAIYRLGASQIEYSLPKITLQEWQALAPMNVIRSFLTKSTSETIADDIRNLVLPYLFSLNARQERQESPFRYHPQDMIGQYLLTSDLDIVLSVFEASKPTMPESQRIISEDSYMTKVSLACLYGSNSVDDWELMGQIFECLPVWETEALVETDACLLQKISQLRGFLTPSALHPNRTPSDLFEHFSSWETALLSRLLDVLDVHLESGEILARWGVGTPLYWFLESFDQAEIQRGRATRMARQYQHSPGFVDDKGEWSELLHDMLKLARAGSSLEKGGFGALSRSELCRIFFSGLLSSGNFVVAQRLLKQPDSDLNLIPEEVESLCLAASEEFFNNASTGNLNTGSMRLAYECLKIPLPSEPVRSARAFIEATSRISSFNVQNRFGSALTPLEIKLTADRLDLVSEVLTANAVAYKHPDDILELVNNLGFNDNALAATRALAMTVEVAMQSEDFPAAADICERMIDMAHSITACEDDDSAAGADATEVCWKTCFQLGSQVEYQDTLRKMNLVGQALNLCQAEDIPNLLSLFKSLELTVPETRRQTVRQREVSPKGISLSQLSTSALTSRLREFRSGLSNAPSVATDAASSAGRTFNRAFGTKSWVDSAAGRSPSPDVPGQAKHALSRGIGWLIGVDEN